MASYNLIKAPDRARQRADYNAELAACMDGTWPRDTSDAMRWLNYPRNQFDSNAEALRKQREYAAKMCRSGLAYLDDLERRLAARDPDLEGYAL
jgi:hypothetical protein